MPTVARGSVILSVSLHLCGNADVRHGLMAVTATSKGGVFDHAGGHNDVGGPQRTGTHWSRGCDTGKSQRYNDLANPRRGAARWSRAVIRGMRMGELHEAWIVEPRSAGNGRRMSEPENCDILILDAFYKQTLTSARLLGRAGLR
jgi:hypothetical protein